MPSAAPITTTAIPTRPGQPSGMMRLMPACMHWSVVEAAASLPRTSLISSRWPSGSRKKARISRPCVTGGVRNSAPRSRRMSYAAMQSGTRRVSSWRDGVRVGRRGEADRRLIARRSATGHEEEPHALEPHDGRRAAVLAVVGCAEHVAIPGRERSTSVTTRSTVSSTPSVGKTGSIGESCPAHGSAEHAAGRAPVCSPASTTISPPTTTHSIPVGNCLGWS